jgi:N-acetylmuramoyl-L-alanine amidase
MCDDANQIETAPSSSPSTGASELSRRAVILAGAGLLLASCTRRSMDPMHGIPVRDDRAGYQGGATTGSAGSSTAPTTRPVQPEAIAGAGYVLVPRRAWTSEPVKQNRNPMGTVTRITVHHTGEHGNWADLPDIEIVQRIERYHRNEKEWAAIGYHFLVGKDGKVYEGRPAQFQGAHTSTQNENNLGISVIGDFMRQPPSGRQLSALKAILDDKRAAYGVSRKRCYGHRDLHASQCPGDALHAWLGRYKAGSV